jgi:hypothetical protein
MAFVAALRGGHRFSSDDRDTAKEEDEVKRRAVTNLLKEGGWRPMDFNTRSCNRLQHVFTSPARRLSS